jgi:hypothetical protein
MRHSPTVRPAVPYDGVAMGRFVREADRQEYAAFTTDPVGVALYSGICEADEAYTVEGAERPMMIFGVQRGYVWAAATDELLDHKAEFMRRSRPQITDIASRHGRLWTASDARNVVHHRWLEWCGFQYGGRVNHNGFPFIVFNRTAT